MAGSAPARMRSRRPPSPRWRDLARYGALWSWGLLRYTAWRALARLTGTHTVEGRASKARQILQDLGPVGVLVGRRLAMRVELIQLTMSLELSRLQVAAPPFSVEVVIARLEEVTGRPVGETFAAIDPTPLASGPLSCVWLGELLDGRRVTIRAGRPHVRRELGAAVRVLGVVARAFEAASVLLPGLFDTMERDLDDLVRHGTDLQWAGRLQVLLRERLQRDGPKGVSAPRVITEWLREDLLVAEHVQGVSLATLVAAVEGRDEATLRELAGQGIFPEAVARRLLELSWWQLFEAMFLEAEPGATRIVVEPGGRLVVVFVEDCAILSRHHRRLVRDALVMLSNDDITGAADALVRAMSPIPRVDVYELRRGLEARLAAALHRTRNPDAPWLWRTALGIWTALLGACGEHEIDLRPGLARALRADMTVSVLAGRIWPGIDLWDAFEGYIGSSQRRFLHAARRRARRLRVKPRHAAALRRQAARATAQRTLRLLEGLVDAPPVRMHALQGKGAHVFTVGVRGVVAGVVGTAAGVLATSAWTGAPLAEASRLVVTHPLWALAVLLLSWMVTRVILFRLDDLDGGR